jgi:hypothetical protein
LSEFEDRHRAYYAMLNDLMQGVLFQQRFEPKGRVPMPDAPSEPVRGPVDTGDGPTPQRLAMAGDDVEDFVTSAGRLTKRLLDGHPLERMNNRGMLSGDQYVAGWAFCEDHYFSGLEANGVVDPTREIVDGGTHKPMNDRQLDALFRWKRAVQAVGPIHSRVLICMLILEESALSYGRRTYRRTQAKGAKLAANTALVDALQSLDWHYHGQRRNPTRSASLGPISEAQARAIDKRDPEF